MNDKAILEKLEKDYKQTMKFAIQWQQTVNELYAEALGYRQQIMKLQAMTTCTVDQELLDAAYLSVKIRS
jgi:hypothetical protein